MRNVTATEIAMKIHGTRKRYFIVFYDTGSRNGVIAFVQNQGKYINITDVIEHLNTKHGITGTIVTSVQELSYQDYMKSGMTLSK